MPGGGAWSRVESVEGRVREREPTERQRAFVRAVLDPKRDGKRGALTDAWESVYGRVGSRRNRSNQASRDWRNPCVVAEADRQRGRQDAARCRAVSGDRQRIRERLWAEAEGADRSSDRIAALVNLGKMRDVQLFSDHRTTVVEDRATDAELVAEIAAALAKVPGDVSAPEVPGPPPQDQDPTPPSGGTVLN